MQKGNSGIPIRLAAHRLIRSLRPSDIALHLGKKVFRTYRELRLLLKMRGEFRNEVFDLSEAHLCVKSVLITEGIAVDLPRYMLGLNSEVRH